VKTWHVVWNDSQNEVMFICKAKDVEHAIRQWKRANPGQAVRRIVRLLS
jgi:hypothetical protein